MTRRIAITGASGFLGSYILERLRNHPIEIIATSTSARTSKSENIKWKVLDLASPPSAPFSYLGEPDLLIHLAWAGLPNYKSTHHFASELPRQYDFLRQMVSSGLKDLFVTGTCFEYGMVDGQLTEDQACQPCTPYGFAKLSLLQQLHFLQEEIEFELTWARLFYTFGEGHGENSLWSQFQNADEVTRQQATEFQGAHLSA